MKVQGNAESLPPGKRKSFQWILPLEAMSFPLEMCWTISVSEPFLKLRTTKSYLVLNKWELVLLCPEGVETFCDYKVVFLFMVRKTEYVCSHIQKDVSRDKVGAENRY